MTRGRGAASLVASPVLVGAVTVLIVIVSVFLAYNANQGLPFVPTYNIKAQLPGGANLVPGNEVRIGGFRVGVIDTIGTSEAFFNGRNRAIAVVRMKLDKVAQPLPVDTSVLVRPRSALGLKYIQLTPGHSRHVLRPGDTIALKNATAPVEFDDFLNTFDQQTRKNSQDALTGFGDAFAGRGPDLNVAIQSFAPFFRYLAPVMSNLSNPATKLDQFFLQIGRASAQVAPVAAVQAQLFADMADTFQAIGQNPAALEATIAKGPPTEDAAIQSFRVQRPFLVDFTDLSNRLRPAIDVLPDALPKLNAALAVGQPVVAASPTLNINTAKLFSALDTLARDPNTLLGLKDLNTLVRVSSPLFTYLNPFVSVCNYATYFLNGLGSHISESVTNGTAERTLVKTGQNRQDNRWGDFGADRPADLPSNVNPINANTGPPDNEPLYVLHGQPYGPAIDAQGNADCLAGQYGYPAGPLADSIPYPFPYPAYNGTRDPDGTYNTWSRAHAGGSHLVVANDPPFDFGPTFTGLANLRDIDPKLRADGFKVP
ncbi:MAG: MCE family protein [Actinobacteria bacterium]|nr:MCE family protein [Actinomycetota bacterium]